MRVGHMTFLEETIVGPADITTLEDPAEKSEERGRREKGNMLTLFCSISSCPCEHLHLLQL